MLQAEPSDDEEKDAKIKEKARDVEVSIHVDRLLTPPWRVRHEVVHQPILIVAFSNLFRVR